MKIRGSFGQSGWNARPSSPCSFPVDTCFEMSSATRPVVTGRLGQLSRAAHVMPETSSSTRFALPSRTLRTIDVPLYWAHAFDPVSGFERRGRWNVPKRLTSVALFGGGVIDLRYADFTAADVEIHSYSIFGGQTILLPPELNVDVRGVGVMGAFDHLGDQGSPGAPHVTIRGFSLWGSVGIKRKKRKAQQ